MKLIDGRKFASYIYAELAPRIKRLRKAGVTPKIVTILNPKDAGSVTYVRKKMEAAEMLGMLAEKIELSPAATTEEAVKLVQKVCKDKKVQGVLVQLPLNKKIDSALVLRALDPAKDVDGFQAYNLGKLVSGFEDLPVATPAGVVALLEAEGMKFTGKHAVIVGASIVVGRPLAVMLINRGATVTVCNSSTKNLAKITKQADILISATGACGLITKKHVKDGVVIIDVGFARGEDGKLCGDVRLKELEKTRCRVTPVPGGVGPVTVATLMKNLVRAAERQNGIETESIRAL